MPVSPLLVGLVVAIAAGGPKDSFGVLEKYPTAPGGPTWASTHWADGQARKLAGRDPRDPTGISQSGGDQAEVWVDGRGQLEFRGTAEAAEPRLHLQAPTPFKNVEVTFYYRKEKDFDLDWAGAVLGVRSGPEGHGKEPCDAHTYYARLRNDGTMDFEKELKHPASSVRNGGNVWNGASDLPASKWIGVKIAAYNVTVGGKKGVKLELYRDLADGAGGGKWKKLGETVDVGGWAPPQNGGACPGVPADYVPLKGGVIVLRNTGVIRASYKWMSVREITPPS